MTKQTFPNVHNKEELIAHLAQGNEVEYLFFWGHTAKTPARVGKECLSQWYPASFNIDGVHYPTAEHYMMAEKARLFHDDAAWQKIVNASDPHTAKQFGREVKNYNDEIWKQQRIEIVVRGNKAKFAQNEELKTFLQATGEKILVEASPRDRIWGIGLDASNPDVHNPAKWRGLNLLGFALMGVRKSL